VPGHLGTDLQSAILRQKSQRWPGCQGAQNLWAETDITFEDTLQSDNN
jgi:hypothetical protein